jgi:hypothetical protein
MRLKICSNDISPQLAKLAKGRKFTVSFGLVGFDITMEKGGLNWIGFTKSCRIYSGCDVNSQVTSLSRLQRCAHHIQSWAEKGRYQPTIEEFCLAMDVPESYTKNFKETRRRVIEPAVSELIHKNNMLIKWDVQRAGRKVIGLDFKFSENPQQSLL